MDFERRMCRLKHSMCSACKQVSLKLKVDENQLCSVCAKKGASYALDNRLLPVWYDRGVPQYRRPEELLCLTLAERMCIQQVSCFIPMQYISKGTFGLKGHVCCFPQEIGQICTVLPRLPSQVEMVKMVRKVTTTVGGPTTDKTFTVRRKQVLAALRWLKKHNEVYRDITIAEDNLDWLEGKESGDIGAHWMTEDEFISKYDHMQSKPGCKVTNLEEINKDNGPAFDQVMAPRQRDDEEHMPAYGIHNDNMAPLRSNDDDDIAKILRNAVKKSDPNKATIMFPASSIEACSEYDSTLKIFCMAFPDLFPGGIADINDQRDKKVSVSEWAAHLMRYFDGRFSTHQMFPFYVFNYITRHRNRETSNYFLDEMVGDNVESVEDVKKLIEKGDKSILSKISYISQNIMGNDGYYRKKKLELNAWIRSKIDCGQGPPNFFITLSCAEYYWPDLIRVVNERIKLCTGTMGTLSPDKPGLVAAMNAHSGVVQEFFQIRVKEWLETVGRRIFNIGHYWVRYEFAPSRGQIHAHLLAI